MQALREAFPTAKSRDAFFSAYLRKNNADLFYGGIGLAGIAASVLWQFICRRFAASGFLVHLHAMKVTLNQKFSVVQFLKSVRKVVTSDTWDCLAGFRLTLGGALYN